MRISVVLGTRPEAIKLAPLILALRSDPRFDCQVCAAAQHREMLDQVLQVFSIVPDVDLDLMRPNQSLPDLTCRAISSISDYLVTAKPALVLVQGDTTTVFAACLSAFYRNIPVGHVEAGLRTGNLRSPWPEEANRVLTSHLTSLHFAPTEVAQNNLLREGIAQDRINVTGNTVIDALYFVVQKNRSHPPEVPGIHPALMNGSRHTPLVLITGHRRENIGDKLRSMCLAIAKLAVRFPEVQFVYPVHLNPNVRTTVWETLRSNHGSGSGLGNVHLIDPLTYVPFIALMERATLILTDSGGIQEEAPALGKPVLVMRDTTERPEAIACGSVKLVGTDTDKIVNEASRLLSEPAYYERMARIRSPYGDGKAAGRIVNAITDYFGIFPAEASATAEVANTSVN